ncbi:MAG: hypothetical protein Q4B54_09685, partial [Coriobacteriales bacterium]|nr:hypothetical protein [Coriobacteriales bacterium]
MKRNSRIAQDLSRRSFVKIAVGSLVSLPAVAGGFITPAAQARADEAISRAEQDGGSAEDITTEITVVAPWELGIYVGDMADGGKTHVVGAKVKVYSRYNQKSLEATTNNVGTALFDIRGLCENPDNLPVDQLTEYEFNGSIEVTKDGYREFATALVRLKGHDCVLAPTRRIENAQDPWPRMASLDEWDILYTENTFYTTPAVTEDRKLRMQWHNMWSDDEATVELREKDATTSIVSTKAAVKGGVLDVTLEEPLLNSDHAAALKPDTTYEALVSQGNNHALIELKVNAQKGHVDEETQKNDVQLVPFNNLTTNKTSMGNFPASIPLVGNTPIMEWLPDFYVNVCLNPFGYFQLTVKTPSWGYKTDNGNDESTKGTKVWPIASVKDQFEKTVKKADKMLEKASSSYEEKGTFRQTNLTTAFSALVNAQIVAIGQWYSDKHLFQGELAGQLFVTVSFNLSENFWCGPIPVIVGFSIDWVTIISLGCGIYSLEDDKANMLDTMFDIDNWKFDHSDTGLTVTFDITPTLSLGVGIDGALSATVKGKFTLTLVFGFTYRGNEADGKPLPHDICGYSAQIQLILKMFLFTKTFNIKNWKYKKFYDNWDHVSAQSLQAQAEEPLSAMAGLSMSDMLSQVNIVTDDMLEETVEFRGMPALSASSEDDQAAEALTWRDLRSDDIAVPLKDGKVINYTVIPFPGPSKKVALTAASEDAVPTRRTIRRRTPSIDYTPAHTGLFAMADSNSGKTLPEAGVSQLGEHGGVKPTSDVILNKDENGNVHHIYGDPRIAVVDMITSMGGVNARATCSFRIGSVSINGAMRTRVIMTVLDASSVAGDQSVDVQSYIGTSKPIEFDINDLDDVSHEDLYDYEFGVAFTSKDGYDLMHLVVVSGSRKQDDSTSFADVATDLVVTYLNFEATDAFGRIEPATISMRSSSVLGVDDSMYHTITNICCATDGTDESNTLLIGYLDRSADTAEGTMEAGATTKVGFLFYDIDEDELRVPDRDDVDEAMGPIETESIYEMSLSPRIRDAYTLTLTAVDDAEFFILNFADGAFSSVEQGTVEGGNHALRLIPWPQDNCFLVSYPDAAYAAQLTANNLWKKPDEWEREHWHLQKAWWDNGSLQFAPIGPARFNFSTFALNSSGTFIFWPQGRSGDDGRVYDEDGNEICNEDKPLYQLMACRVRHEKFSDPFVVAEIDHDMDSVCMVATHDRYAPVEVLSSESVDTGATDSEGNVLYYASDLWYTSVPNLRCATAIGCDTDVPLVASGGTMKFNISIRNDGNSYLSGCTVQMYVHTNQVLDKTTGHVLSETVTKVDGASATITFSKDSIVDSHWTPFIDGAYQNVEDDFALAPGKSATYFAMIHIPDNWEGEKVISFTASNPTVAEGGSLTAMDEESSDIQAFSVEGGTYRIHKRRSTPNTDLNQTHMETIQIHAADLSGEDVSDSPVSVWSGDPSNKPNNKPSVNPSVKPSSKSAQMWRLYNPNSGEHFYTASAGERKLVLDAGWNDEGKAWLAPTLSSTPVYRLYNKNGGDHHYTSSAGERDLLIAQGWIYEGIGWYSDDDKSVPVYRQYNPNATTGAHNFTVSSGERDLLIKEGWSDEGTGWYG